MECQHNDFSDFTCYISYSRKDGADIKKFIYDFLIKRGVNIIVDIFLDEVPILPEDTLKQAAQKADILIFICTPSALQSDIVQLEIMYFDQIKRGKIIPIIFGNISLVDKMPGFLNPMKILEGDQHILYEKLPKGFLLELLEIFKDLCLSIPSQKKERSTLPQGQKKRLLNEGKLLLVGRGEVGKTSIMRRLINSEFNGDEAKTQGINITRWHIKCQSDILRINVWDFGGQEIMHATHQFFLTERSLYLLVLNGREGGEDFDAEYWLKHIESFGGASPVIIVQNKINQHAFDLNYRGLKARFPQIQGFVKTDCQNATGINELNVVIQQALLKMSEIRMQFPSDWWSIKEKLESMDQNYMSYDRFCQLCESEGIYDESDISTLCFILHCLGIALNYRGDSRLRETSVLKPLWLTNGIYKILNARKVAEQQGELHIDDLKQILNHNEYPIEKHFFLLEIMRKFSLCFAFPYEVDRYLIPELLGKEEPEEIGQFEPCDCLNFEYAYGIIPEGLIPRFIVRSHTLSHNQARWRSGVILVHDDCKAMVIAEMINRRVIVRVKGGDVGSRRRLLAIIRYDFDRIHQEFNECLEVEEKVPLKNFPTFSVNYKKLIAFERDNILEFHEYIGQKVIPVKVSELLNGVDLNKMRFENMKERDKPTSIFISYSHKDEFYREALETHLKLLQRQGFISIWSDRKILQGNEWDHEIDSNLEKSNIILLLISADFISSKYCWEKELARAMERHESGEAKVIPVMLRTCDYKDAPFNNLEGLPKDMKPINTWQDIDVAFTDVAKGIRDVIEQLK